jgi:predicted anti-sigma-YlaC factor YlaD
MKKVCSELNRFRDEMLDPGQRKQYALHLEQCEECRIRMRLLDNLARTMKSRQLPELIQNPEKVAELAYEKSRSWDILLLTWLRPASAWSGLVVLSTFLLLFLFLWTAPAPEPVSANSEYEILMDESNSISTRNEALVTLTDDELEQWLETGGAAQ